MAKSIKVLRALETAIAPGELGEDWVGLVIPIATGEDYRDRPPITKSFIDYYASPRYQMVPKEAVAKALEKRGKTEAARVLRNFPSVIYIRVQPLTCQYITDEHDNVSGRRQNLSAVLFFYLDTTLTF